MEGWIKIHRKSLESSVFINSTIWFVWCWILLKANHENKKFPFNGADITIQRGSFITGRKKALQELPDVTPRMYRTAITYLKTTSRIAIKSNNKFSIITVNNWNDYQPTTSKTTNQRPTNDQPTTTNKNNKNDKNKKNILLGSTKKFSFEEEFMEEMKTQFSLVDVEDQFVRAKDWLSSTGRSYKDYKAFFRNWLRNARPTKQEVIRL